MRFLCFAYRVICYERSVTNCGESKESSRYVEILVGKFPCLLTITCSLPTERHPATFSQRHRRGILQAAGSNFPRHYPDANFFVSSSKQALRIPQVSASVRRYPRKVRVTNASARNDAAASCARNVSSLRLNNSSRTYPDQRETEREPSSIFLRKFLRIIFETVRISGDNFSNNSTPFSRECNSRR